MSPQKKTIIISIIAGLADLALIFFIIFPLFREIKKNSQEITSAKKDLILLETKIQNIEKFKETAKTIQPNLEKGESIFIDPKAPVDFIKFLEKVAADSGILIDIFPASNIQAEKKDSFPSMAFQIVLTGSFPNCLKFMEKMENSPYLLEIQNLTVTRLAEQEFGRKELAGFSIGSVRTNLSLKVYTQ